MIKNIVKGKQIFSKKSNPCYRSRQAGNNRSLRHFACQPGNLCRHGRKYDWRKQSNYRCSGRTVSVCNGKSRDNKEIRGVSDRGKLPVTRRSQKLHQI